MELNTRFSGGYKHYNETIPKYIQDKPCQFLKHCLKRITTVKDIRPEFIKDGEKRGEFVQNDCKKRKFEPSEETNDLTIQTKSRASCPQPVINKGQPEPEGSKLNLDNKDLAFETEDGPISSGKTQQQGKGLSSNPIVIDKTSPYPHYWINCNIDETTITLYAESKKRILQSNYWLADSEIYAGQKLLKKRHPFISGFHSPSI